MKEDLQVVPMREHPVIEFFKGSGNAKSQEKFAEYTFLRDLIVATANQHKKIGISRSDFDAFGFDVLLEYEGRFYPVQLKAVNGKASNWDVHKEFLKKENSRVIVVEVLSQKDSIYVKYKLLQQINISAVISRSPKKAHKDKCKINKGDLVDITTDILAIFNNQ